ncbi:MAG: hypothetical protein Q8Q60_01990 [Candidatus Chromulinivorax sp.]|nr:hypothetical protein [Candidatus Chromulinivorax sp.]
MKKSLLILVLFMQSNCYGRLSEKHILVWKNLVQGIIAKNNFLQAIQDKKIQDIEERKKFNFGTHLRTNFPESNIIDLLVAAYYLEPHQQIQAENAFNRACKNFHTQKSDAKIDPATCTTIGEYLERLKNTR